MNENTPNLFFVKPPNSRLRLISLLYGVLLFVWLTPEDNTVWPVALLGIALALLCTTWLVRRRLGGSAISASYVPVGTTLLGGITGLGGTLATAGFMFFKNALHAHVFWDFPPAMVMAMLTRAPSWTLAGGLMGISAGLLWLWRKTETQVKEESLRKIPVENR